MRHLLFAILVLIGGSASPAQANEACLGIYFDESGTINCLPRTPFNTHTTAYIILKNPSGASIAGWEAELSFDKSLVVGLRPSPDGLRNEASYPQLRIRYDRPLPVKPITVLATLSVFALGPGALSLGPAADPSRAGATTPLYLTDNGPRAGLLAPVCVLPAATGDGRAWIGYADCMAPGQVTAAPTHPAIGYYAMRDPVPVARGETPIRVDGPQPPWDIKDGMDTEAFRRRLADTDFAFLGTLKTARFELVRAPEGSAIGSCAATFAVQEMYWGWPPRSEVEVHIEAFDVPGRLAYTSTPQPRPAAFTPGGRYLVMGYGVGLGAAYVEQYGLFAVADSRLTCGDALPIHVENPLGVARALAVIRDVARVYSDADLVCIANVARGVIRGDPPNPCEAVVVRTLKGTAGPTVSIAYPALPRRSEWQDPPNYLEGDQTYLFLLKQTSYGLIPFRGRASIYVVRNGAYLDLGGAPAPWVANFFAHR